jgi:chromosome segregation ATPase
MDNLENTSDKFKIERLSELVKSLYENIDDLKSRLDKKNITQSNKAFDELYEKHRKLEKDYESLDLKFNELFIELDIAEDTIRDKNKKIYELQDSSLRQGYQFNKLTQEYNEKVNTLINERDYYRSIAQTWHDKFDKEKEESKKKINESYKLIDDLDKIREEILKELKESNHLQLTMRTMYENLYDDYRDVKVELGNYTEYTKDIVEHNKQLRTLVSKLEKEKAILENNAAKHEKEIENLVSTISGMENELAKKDFEIDELSHTIQFASYILKNGGDIPRD